MHTHIYYTYMPPYSFRQMTTPKLLLSPFFVFLSPFPIAPIFLFTTVVPARLLLFYHTMFLRLVFFFYEDEKERKKKKIHGKEK